ncbi:MAG: PKD domain-containing protein [Actinomycetota bacterium]
MGGEIIAERFSLLKTRGSNGLAFTHIVEDTLDGRRLVVKVSDRLGILGLEYLKAANLLSECGVRGVLLPLEGGLLDGEEGYYLAFPEMGEPSLENYLRMRPALDCEEVLHVLRGVLSALRGLHRAGFLHLFLEPRNIFYLPRRTVTLKDPALRAEFFHPFLELVSAPDFSYLHPSLMDGGLPGPEADIYALGKLALRLHASAVDRDTSPLGRKILRLARTCEEEAEKGPRSAGASVIGILDYLLGEVEGKLEEGREGEERLGGRLRSVLAWRRGRAESEGRFMEDPERAVPAGSGERVDMVTVDAAWTPGMLLGPGPYDGRSPGDGAEAGYLADGLDPGDGRGRVRVDALPDGKEGSVGRTSVIGDKERASHGLGKALFSGRRKKAWRGVRAAVPVVCLGLLLLLPTLLVMAKNGRKTDPALGWGGASEAGGGEAPPALRETRRGLNAGADEGGLTAEDSGLVLPGASGRGTLTSEASGGTQEGREEVSTPVGSEAAGQGPISPQRPVAKFTITPAEGQSPLRVYLDASASHDPDGYIVSYRWSCGGGARSFYQVFESNIIPARIGVTLTVTDDGGNTDSVTHYLTLY